MYPFPYRMAVFLIGLLVGGCGSIETAHVLSTLSGKVVLAEIENGTIGKAGSFDQQCKILQEWPGIMNEMTTVSIKLIADRLRDDVFVPVFGRPYDQFTEDEKWTIRRELVGPCLQKSRHWNTTDLLYRVILDKYVKFVKACFDPGEPLSSWSPYLGRQLAVEVKRDRREREEASTIQKEKFQ